LSGRKHNKYEEDEDEEVVSILILILILLLLDVVVDLVAPIFSTSFPM